MFHGKIKRKVKLLLHKTGKHVLSTDTKFLKVNLAVFALIFAGVSSYFLLFSHAAGLKGDINGDGTVNVVDLSLLLSSFGSRSPACTTNPSYTCDLNSDNVVNIFDLSVLLGNYGQSGGSSQACTPNAGPDIHEYVDGCPLYHTGSWVNAPLPANAPIDPNSGSMAAKFSSQIGVDSNGNLIPGSPSGLRWWGYSNVYVTQNSDRSTFKTVCSSEVLNHTSWPWMTDLHNAWMTFKVPVPSDGLPALDGGADNGATIYDAATNEMWDFYKWRGALPAGTKDPQGRTCNYEADGGDYQHGVANSPGYFITQSLGSGVQEDKYWGRRAAALPTVAGDITPDEWNNPLQGFNHALDIIVPWADPNKQYWPATRHDGGSGGVGGLPEGARIRIGPSYTCPHGTAGRTGPTQLAYDRAYELCATLQKYGGIVTDQTGNGASFDLTHTFGGKTYSPKSDGIIYPNWYWDTNLIHALPHLQVINQSYRPPYAPSQN